MPNKKNVLWVVLFTMVVTAAVGIWAVFSDHIGKTQEKILLTTGTVSAVCILMLPGLAHTERKYLRHVAWTAVVLILGTASLTIAVVWIEPGSRVIEKVMASGWVASVAAFAGFITLLANVAKAWTWIKAVTVLLIVTLAAEIIYSVWVQVDWGEKILVTTAILMTLGIISAWVLHVVHWLASRQLGHGQVMCPRCGTVCDLLAGDMQCSSCATVFAVKS